jgi:LruC domain-containing protein
MNRKILSTVFALALLGAACKKENSIDLSNEQLSNFTAPAGFDFRTDKVVNLSIGVTDSRFGNSPFVIEVYATEPTSGATPISKGSATLTSPFNVPVRVSANTTQLWVVKTAVDGSSTTQKLDIGTSTKSVSTSMNTVNGNLGLGSINNGMAAIDPLPDPTCGRTATDNNININSASEVVCFEPKADATIYVTANNGGTLRLNAPNKTITIGDNFNHTNLKIYITTGTTVNFTRDLEIKSGEAIKNNGTMNVANFSIAGTFVNSGTANFTGQNFNLNSGSDFTNAGTATITTQNATVNNSLTNDGHMTFTNSLTINASGSLVNNCNLTVTRTFTVNSSKVSNYKLIVVKGDTYVNSAGVISLYNGAMIQTNDLTNMDGVVAGLGDTRSLFMVVNSVGNNVLNNGGWFKGNLQYSGKQDIEDNQNKIKHFSDGAIKGSDAYIVKDDCNTIGNGVAPAPSKPDTDKDGIIDEKDDYPTDPTKAFNNYSVNYQNGGSTIIFEDNWPAKADYDLNDIVFRYKHKVITNAKNVVVRLEGDWNLVATGGNFNNGAGILFNLPKAGAKNFSASNNLQPEAGQDSLVVILFENSRKEMPTWNTIPGQSISAVKNYTFSFDVTDGPTFAAFGASAYNPFIWNSAAGRGHETHLYGKGPTKLADEKLFGTGDDNSLKGNNYTTSDNLPWGLEIPVSTFQYPVEFANITTAYLKFASWANSGGVAEITWYKETGTAYRNEANIFSK